ncbi:Predicted small integral membrane protein [Celeribacter baekdonensis]|jgi:predicted small integral membrane protein|uniref:Predicted small integral membrane protein n=2 Tax=Celeribacter baekdonensis TaxID=875171 RepID=A0A1G7Q9X6_9RHOB|nr:Predicted small integral membrane protein [Celeribacter baekdonensis]
MRTTRWITIYTVLAAVMGGSLGALILSVPRRNGALDWTGQMIAGGWMAWSFPVALFFWTIACLLILFTVLAFKFPETPRLGALRIETTRGDRLFITLLGSAFINLAWLGLSDAAQWGAVVPCLIYAFAVFRWL